MKEKPWKKLRVVVEIAVPEGTYTEKDWRWAVECELHNARRMLRRHCPHPAGRARAMSYSRHQAALGVLKSKGQ